MASFDIIEDATLQDSNGRLSFVEEAPQRVPDPVVIRGVGQLTLFGLTNKFDTDFPSSLSGKTRNSVEKILDAENCNSYHKLGLHWKISKQGANNSNMTEYVLLLEFRPKQIIYKPD
eukprot:gene7203-8009_t